MSSSSDLIPVLWHVDRTKDPCEYTLRSQHPDYPDLEVRISSSEVTERVARARLMELMFAHAKEQGIPPYRLRFKINGIDD